MERTDYNDTPSPRTATTPRGAVRLTASRSTGGRVDRMGRIEGRSEQDTGPHDDGPTTEMSRNQNLQVEMDLRSSRGRHSGSYHPDRAMSVETQASDTSP